MSGAENTPDQAALDAATVDGARKLIAAAIRGLNKALTFAEEFRPNELAALEEWAHGVMRQIKSARRLARQRRISDG